jgi:hypothetical protein
MERSTKYSTLSGLSGVLIGLIAIAGVAATHWLIGAPAPGVSVYHHPGSLAALWLGVFAAAIAIDFGCNKRRAAGVGKHLVSPLGAHIVLAALPAFFAGAVLTFFFFQHQLLFYVWGAWMLCYGLAICAVGLFSVKPVSILGGAFVLAGAVTLVLPVPYHLSMMAATFGGFHILYGILMARRNGW